MSLKEFIQQIRIALAERKITWNQRWWDDGIDEQNCYVNKDCGLISICKHHRASDCSKVHCKSYPAQLKYEYQLARMRKIKEEKTGNWFMYLVKTPVEQKRLDWAEYEKLRAELRCAGIYKSNMYRRIYKRFLNPDGVVFYNHCVVDYNCRNNKGNLEPRQYRCPSFVTGGCCGDCIVGEKKSKYDDACVKYESLKLKKSVFWQEKFDNVK